LNNFSSKPKLPEGWIDWSVGEPHIVREALFKTLHIRTTHLFRLNEQKKSEYPPPAGSTALVKLLEDKYQAPVVITNGAKQALGAVFYSLNKIGKKKLGMRNPYWALIPPLANIHGLQCEDNYDAYLSILPNNPDGFAYDYVYAKYLANYHKELGIPFIHDAAYYTPIYLPIDYNLGPIGDVQIFSASKMHGMSGIRVGYAVCYNTDYYNLIREYVETMTVGVSLSSQDIYTDILTDLWTDNKKNDSFITEARNKFRIAKALCATINKNILEVPKDIINSNGMFGWFKVGSKCDFKKAKIHTVEGKLFGNEEMVRVNLGLPTNTLIDAIERLNKL
jgi:aspartate/methionine/tyrosine aminotransferase